MRMILYFCFIFVLKKKKKLLFIFGIQSSIWFVALTSQLFVFCGVGTIVSTFKFHLQFYSLFLYIFYNYSFNTLSYKTLDLLTYRLMPCLYLQNKNIQNLPIHFTISPHLIQLLNRDVKWSGEIRFWVSHLLFTERKTNVGQD